MPHASNRLAPFILSASLLPGALVAQSADPVQAHWQLQSIRFTYTGFTTAYSCDALERKVRAILTTLGAHPNTDVDALGCFGNRPSRTAFVDITTAIPTAEPGTAADARESGEMEKRDELLRELNVQRGFEEESFPAMRRTVQLSENRQLDLAPGDCELMAELRDQVLPHLGVKILEENISCVPHQVSITTPTLRVSALVPMKTTEG